MLWYSLVNGWPDGYAFILSFLAPLWTICNELFTATFFIAADNSISGSFDSSVHISEEASNAASAVPWAIVCAIAWVLWLLFWRDQQIKWNTIRIAGVLGWGTTLSYRPVTTTWPIFVSNKCFFGLLHGYRSSVDSEQSHRTAHGPNILQQFWPERYSGRLGCSRDSTVSHS